MSRVTTATLQEMKAKGVKSTLLTAYDYPTARLLDEAGIDILLVGDSLGNVVLGYENTLPVTMEESLHHTAAVARGAKRAMVVGDMPFLSYQTTKDWMGCTDRVIAPACAAGFSTCEVWAPLICSTTCPG